MIYHSIAPLFISRQLVELRIIQCGGIDKEHETLFAGSLHPRVECISSRRGRRQMCRVPFQDAVNLKDQFDALLVSVT